MTTDITLDGTTLTCEQVGAVARGEARVAVGSTAAARAAWHASGQLHGPVYGRTTGVGANKDVAVHEQGLDLARSHAGGAGPLVGEDRTRAMMVIRLNQLLRGGSGVNPGVLPVLAYAINEGFTPPVRLYGAIGTGDLTALSTTALCLTGEVPWRRAPWSPDQAPSFALSGSDALPFMSANAMTLGDAALACAGLRPLLGASIGVAAHSWRAVDASDEPLEQPVQDARRHPGQARVATRLRRLLTPGPSPRLQDPYGYRALPQVHGAAFDALDMAERVVTTDMNSAAENPLIAGGRAWHNGNFHTAPVALALDGLRAALVQTASLSTARLATMMEPAYTGLIPFLADRPGASGALILEYVAYDALATLRNLAAPVTLGGAVLSRSVEDHAGFGTQAARACLATLEPYEIVLACELVAAVRAQRQRGLSCDVPLDPRMEDRPLDADIEAARAALPGFA
ncbi:aromatic amino acid ammonia-lyase [Planotetraspora phitsanulokensis]|uniref:Histidine ammonia-lyase n=1 Tax=Planotetraspora phitsanulokensis TaxID=575192 RepID=A0A8J3XFU5_9ACTN|nr:aromatic amino acid lyase [Planotetraspora phitsanulokensis]GII40087.1 histidine ammonia-lyase [Planotetraspora phitsanulokensis]